jgi:arylsulfatase
MALRVRNWKIAFLEQNTELAPQTPISIWQGQFTKLRVPNIYNLRADPFERATSSLLYGGWQVHRGFLLVPAQAVVAKYLESFKDFPPRSKPASFTVSDVMEKLTTSNPGNN